jgi:hypothetical protein
LGTGAVEVGELTQHQSIGDPFAQFAIVPVLDAHENQRAQDLLRRQSTATAPRLLQASYQIASDPLDHLLLVVKEVGNGLQQRFQFAADLAQAEALDAEGNEAECLLAPIFVYLRVPSG